jgi:hypothetical protein
LSNTCGTPKSIHDLPVIPATLLLAENVNLKIVQEGPWQLADGALSMGGQERAQRLSTLEKLVAERIPLALSHDPLQRRKEIL